MRQAFLFNLPSFSQWWSKYHLACTSSSNKTLGSQAQPFLVSPVPWSRLLLGQGVTVTAAMPPALLLMALPAQPSQTAKDQDLPLPHFLLTHGKQLCRWSCPFSVEDEPDSSYISCQIKWVIFIWVLAFELYFSKETKISISGKNREKTPNCFLRRSPEATICKTRTFLDVDKAISSWLFQKTFIYSSPASLAALFIGPFPALK